MIEILLIIIVVKTFVKVAKEKKLNHKLWGLIGALSYYVPILLWIFLILPLLVEKGIYSPRSEGETALFIVITSIVIGVICCFVAYRILKSQPSQDATMPEDVIDHIK